MNKEQDHIEKNVTVTLDVAKIAFAILLVAIFIGLMIYLYGALI